MILQIAYAMAVPGEGEARRVPSIRGLAGFGDGWTREPMEVPG